MKGVIILPKYLIDWWPPVEDSAGLNFDNVLSADAQLYYALRDTFGFELRYADEVDVDSDTDVVCMFGVPYHNRPSLIPGLVDLNKRIKLVMWPGDLQCYGHKECLDSKLKVFERCDAIVSFSYEYFKQQYPQFMGKHILMSKFFSPDERYTQFSLNESPIMKCLLSGSLNNEVYPLRSFLLNHRTRGSKIAYSKPTLVGNNYSRQLHSYFCGFTCSSIFNYVLAKCLEITATGSLLLVEECADLKKTGLIPYEHYVPVTKNNILLKIEDCLHEPGDYRNIRLKGMEFVRKNHGIANRVEQTKEIFNRLW